MCLNWILKNWKGCNRGRCPGHLQAGRRGTHIGHDVGHWGEVREREFDIGRFVELYYSGGKKETIESFLFDCLVG